MVISKRYVMTSQTVARRLPGVLQARGLDASTINDWVLTAEREEVWLFAVVNTRKVDRLEQYSSRALVHQISTVCDGTPVGVQLRGVERDFLGYSLPVTLVQSIGFVVEDLRRNDIVGVRVPKEDQTIDESSQQHSVVADGKAAFVLRGRL